MLQEVSPPKPSHNSPKLNRNPALQVWQRDSSPNLTVALVHKISSHGRLQGMHTQTVSAG